MDFGSVLYKAQKNDQTAQQGTSWYKAGFDPPKKEQREKKLSLNIQKFLARKEEEEKQKKLEAERKRQELLELRSKDKKSVKRVQSMLKRTKSANKSVLEDAIDNVNTAVTASGLMQPDEDDYGYVSKNAEELYNKLINKYNSIPAEESNTKKTTTKTAEDILSTKERVKAALEREEEEKLLPRKRKRKSKTENGEEADDQQQHSDDEKNDSGKEEPPEKKSEKPKSDKFRIPKKNPQAPPPLDFHSLLKLAEQKQHEPIVIEKVIEDKPERPMTSKEKEEYMRERERKMRREMLLTSNARTSDPSRRVDASNAKASDPSRRVDTNTAKASDPSKKVDAKLKVENKPAASLRPTDSKSSLQVSNSSSSPKREFKKAPQKLEKTEVPSNSAHKIHRVEAPQKTEAASSNGYKTQKVEANPKHKTNIVDARKSLPANDKLKTQFEKPSSDSKSILMMKARKEYLAEQQRKNLDSRTVQPSSIKEKEKLPVKVPDSGKGKLPDSGKPKLPDSGKISQPSEKLSKLPEKRDKTAEKRPAPDARSQSSKQVPSRNGVREFPPRDVVRQFPPRDMVKKKPAPPVRRKVIESDDEYDSEMDDFIDDTEDPNDVSKYISEIFGYDRKKYSRYDNDDDDDECMESNFSELQKEEFISTKYGILEDLADVRRTKMEKDRKKKRLMSKG